MRKRARTQAQRALTVKVADADSVARFARARREDMERARVCPECQSVDAIQLDPENCERVCTDCGMVVELDCLFPGKASALLDSVDSIRELDLDENGRPKNKYKRVSYMRVRWAHFRGTASRIPADTLERLVNEYHMSKPGDSGRAKYPPPARVDKRTIQRLCRAIGMPRLARYWITIRCHLTGYGMPPCSRDLTRWVEWFHEVLQQPFEDERLARKHFPSISYFMHQAFLNADHLFGTRLHPALHKYFPLVRGPRNLVALDDLFGRMIMRTPPHYHLVHVPLRPWVRSLGRKHRVDIQ